MCRQGVRCGAMETDTDATLTPPEVARLFKFDVDADEDFELISEEEARAKMSALLTHDMAYGAKLMDEEKAEELTECFFRQFGEAEYYVCADAAWEDCTFEASLVIVGHGSVGLFWVGDED
mmetsp:Transcript_7022/g.15557  ORF Transcript_7022/g.15557 Transcript_7022/m.15557 type:complete len:121 (-) Transcript_7022:44-406(-)